MVVQFLSPEGIRLVDLPVPLPPQWEILVQPRLRYWQELPDLPVQVQKRLFRRISESTYQEVT